MEDFILREIDRLGEMLLLIARKLGLFGENAAFMDKMLSAADPDYASDPGVKWNFTKFLIGRDGLPVARFEPTVSPESIASQIEALL